VLAKPHLDLTSKIGQGFLAFLSVLAEDERERIVKRANASVQDVETCRLYQALKLCCDARSSEVRSLAA
jgi:hypothetical protein